MLKLLIREVSMMKRAYKKLFYTQLVPDNREEYDYASSMSYQKITI